MVTSSMSQTCTMLTISGRYMHTCSMHTRVYSYAYIVCSVRCGSGSSCPHPLIPSPLTPSQVMHLLSSLSHTTEALEQHLKYIACTLLPLLLPLPLPLPSPILQLILPPPPSTCTSIGAYSSPPSHPGPFPGGGGAPVSKVNNDEIYASLQDIAMTT